MRVDSPARKFKIFNDPVYGFINITDEVLFEVLEHPYFQRLRRIKQLGLTHLVYPGALHTRFHHALGAMNLMGHAIDTLQSKGHLITPIEKQAALLAILLHDIGHGPFSHALEKTLVKNINHEQLSLLFMYQLKSLFPDEIGLAIEIFTGSYPKKFLHKLVSGQLDMDRLDYLNRDSFFTGVSEGVVSYDRIIKTLNIADSRLVTDEKGIYSLEKFIIARRLMYWQVYLHKTVISAEYLLTTILSRARQLAVSGVELFATPALKLFLENAYTLTDFENNPNLIADFAQLDDFDVFTSIKVWCSHPDKILSALCNRLVSRRLFKIELQEEDFGSNYITKLLELTSLHMGITMEDAHYFVSTGTTENNAYDPGVGNIWILRKNGIINDIAEISDQLNIRVLSHPVKKNFICYPKEIAHLVNN